MLPKVAIIGAGPSGLVAAKEAKENSLQPVVFEKSKGLGGVWNPKMGSVWNAMRTNLSCFNCMFSDFPWKGRVSLFPTRNQLHGYLVSYAKHFKIFKDIRFNAAVTKICRVGQKWSIWSKGKKGTFKYVIVASGIFSKPHMVNLKGKFKGQQLHSSQCRDLSIFKGKRVTVIGGAFSGAELAAEVSKFAKKTTQFIRRPYWVVPRIIGQKPVDLVFYKRGGKGSGENPNQSMSRIRGGDQSSFSPLLKMDPNSQEPVRVVISDEYLNCVKQNKIEVRLGEIQEFNTDVIIHCTGYRLNLDFMSKEIKESLSFQQKDQLQPVLLHQLTFHPELPNMAFVGLYRGPFFGILELQARWATLVFSGKKPYPTQKEMEEGIRRELAIRDQNPRPQFPHGDYVRLADSLARICGVFPKDPIVQGAPVIPSHYRLTGFGSKPLLAKKVIELSKKTQGVQQVTFNV